MFVYKSFVGQLSGHLTGTHFLSTFRFAGAPTRREGYGSNVSRLCQTRPIHSACGWDWLLIVGITTNPIVACGFPSGFLLELFISKDFLWISVDSTCGGILKDMSLSVEMRRVASVKCLHLPVRVYFLDFRVFVESPLFSFLQMASEMSKYVAYDSLIKSQVAKYDTKVRRKRLARRDTDSQVQRALDDHFKSWNMLETHGQIVALGRGGGEWSQL